MIIPQQPTHKTPLIRKTTLLLLCLLISAALCISAAAAAGGSGIAGDPYLIETPAELQAMNTDLAAYYAMQNDIDLTGVTWNPVGSTTTPFIGGLTGNNHTITGLTISRPTTDYQALFGVLGPGATISHFSFTSFDIAASDNVGTVFGRVRMASATNTTCTITNVDISNSKITGGTAGSYVGSLGGLSITYSNIDVSYCDMENNTISACGHTCEGLMGSGTNSNILATIANCTIANCSVTSGGSNCGGLMGYGAHTNSQATATNCVVENCVVISGGYYCGGLMGSGAYTNSQATASGCTVTKNTLVSTSGYTAGAFGRIYTGCAGYVDGCTFEDNTIIALSGISAGVVAAWS